MAQAVAGNREAQLIEMAILPTLSYAAHCMPEITADIAAVDDAMRWGYGHDLGPFQVWDALGVAATATRLRQLGLEVAGWVEQLLASDQPAFYGQQGSVRTVYRPSSGQHEPLEQGAAYLDLAALKAAGKTVLSTTTASLIDLGDGVLCLEFHSKANAVGQEALHLLDQALDLLAEDPWRAMVIGNQGVYFCAGINLNELGAMAQATDPATMVSFLEKAHRQMQRLRFAPKPVVAAPFAQTMGLGVELSVACSAICAEADVAMGLVEAGVGLIPGGGGCKELVRRVVSPPMLTPGADPLPALRRVLEMVATAKVSTSAAEARDMGFLAASDRIVFGRDRLLAAAKQLALTLADAGYQPPTPGRSCYAAGETALAALVIDIHLLRAGGFITEYDAVIARTLAATLCGGALSAAQWVDEDYMLAQEREGFERLLSDERTQARIREFLKTGVRLRN
jgi:3-hydroxyacyl-CoA dehydrogenase